MAAWCQPIAGRRCPSSWNPDDCRSAAHESHPSVDNSLDSKNNPQPNAGRHAWLQESSMPAEDLMGFGAILHTRLSEFQSVLMADCEQIASQREEELRHEIEALTLKLHGSENRRASPRWPPRVSGISPQPLNKTTYINAETQTLQDISGATLNAATTSTTGVNMQSTQADDHEQVVRDAAGPLRHQSKSFHSSLSVSALTLRPNRVDRQGTSGGAQEEQCERPSAESRTTRLVQLQQQAVSIQQSEKRRRNRRFSKDASEVLFDNVMGLITITNILTIGISADFGRGSFKWLIVDIAYAGFFFVEIVVKCLLHGFSAYFRGPRRFWHSLDVIMLFMSCAEVALSLIGSAESSKNQLSLFRILRLLRIARLVRIYRMAIFKDLMMMINGMIGGMRTLFCSILLICLPLYAIALVMRESIGEANGSQRETFRSVKNSIFTVFRCLVSGDCTDKGGRPLFILVTEEYGWLYGVIYCLTVLLMTFGLFNVIIALYVEQTVAAAKHNDILQRRLRLQDQQRLAIKTTELIQALWKESRYLGASGELDGFEDGTRTVSSWRESFSLEEANGIEITFDMFEQMITKPQIQEILGDLDVPEEDRVDLFDILDADCSGSLQLEELVSGITRLRGDSRRSDIISVALQVREVQLSLRSLNNVMASCIAKVEESRKMTCQWVDKEQPKVNE